MLDIAKPARASYERQTRAERARDWAPVSIATMRHIAEQMGHPPDSLSEPLLRQAARGFLAPYRGPVHFAGQRHPLGETSVLLLTLSALRIDGAGMPPIPLVYITFVLAGRITVTPRDGEPTVMPPGAASAISDWRAFTIESSDGTRLLQLLMPTERLTERGAHLQSARFALDASQSLRAPLRGLALALADSSWTSSPLGELVAERTLHDLVAGMFLESEPYLLDPDDLRAGLRRRALSYIATHHREVTLNPRLVAEHLAVSLRHLQRAFEATGVSVARAIAARRADSAAVLLSAPGAAALTIEEVAQRAGFRSAFELRAAFRSEYAMLPSAYRDSRLGARSSVPEQP